jgi:hypothetical protein
VLYAYAIVEAPQRPLPACGGHGGAPLKTVAAGAVGAVCSGHADDVRIEPDEAALWRHENVVEALLEDRAVLPVRFGTVVRDEQELRELLRRRREAFAAALDLVRGRREIGVRVLWDPPEPEGIDADASGSDYLLARLAVERAAQARAENLHAALCEQAVMAQHRVLETPRLLLSGCYLVDQDGIPLFLAAADELASRSGDVVMVCTGPWPAHSFGPSLEQPA